MSRLLVIARLSAVAALATSLAAGNAAASHPDILRDYRFITSRSTVHVTGGFAGWDQTLNIHGTFGLATGYEEGVACLAIGCPDPSHIPYARFVDVDAILFNPMVMAPIAWPGWDLDDTLNLSGLKGTFQLGDPNRLFFHGEDAQGQPIRLQAAIHGKLLHIVGENDPVNRADGGVCSDCFGYKINALAYLRPYADANMDGNVDAADYVSLRKLLSQSAAGSEGEAAAGDFDLWQASFGETVDFSQFATNDASTAAVPEPASILALLIGAGFTLLNLRQVRNR